MAARAVPAPLAALPNALTIARLILVPIYVVLILRSDGGHSWPAAIVFGVAAVTDQVDHKSVGRFGQHFRQLFQSVDFFAID